MIKDKFKIFDLQKIGMVATFFLFILAIATQIRGYHYLTFSADAPLDFARRWRELQYIYQGHYPHPTITPDSPYFDPDIGSASYGGYFPWSFFSLTWFIPPFPLGIARVYFTLVNVVSMVITSLFIYRRYEHFGKFSVIFSLVSVWAISANYRTLHIGQLGILLNALVIIFWYLLERGKLTWAGIFLGVSLMKPNFTALYFFIPVAQKKYKLAIVSILYVISMSLLLAIVVQRSPIELTLISVKGMFGFADQGNSLLNVFQIIGVPIQLGIPILLILGMIVVPLMFNRVAKLSLINQFAIASVIGRLWTYHRVYDNVMLLFLYLAVLELTMEKPNRPNIFMLCLLGFSLWIPLGWRWFVSSTTTEMLLYIIWVASLVFLLIRSPPKHQLEKTNTIL